MGLQNIQLWAIAVLLLLIVVALLFGGTFGSLEPLFAFFGAAVLSLACMGLGFAPDLADVVPRGIFLFCGGLAGIWLTIGIVITKAIF